MSSLQQAPQGWLGALGLKATGKNPDTVRDDIVGVIESGAFYFPPEVRQFTQTVTTPLPAGATVSLVVPDKESWIVYAAGGNIPLLALDNVVDNSGLVLSYALNANLPTMQLAVGPVVPKGAITTSGGLYVAHTFPRALLLPPKALVSIRVMGETTLNANRTAQVNALIYAFSP